jgi:ATP-dependent helicase/DNAse subunit B
MDNQLSKVEIDQATAFMMFYQIAESFLGDLSFYSVDLRRNQSLEDLIVLNAKFDRLLETLELTQRAIDKENGSTKNRISDRSPLSSLKFILKTNKRRPK